MFRSCFLCLLAFAAWSVQAPADAQVKAVAPDAPSASPQTAADAAEPTLVEAERLLNAGKADAALTMLNAMAARNPEPAGVEKLRGMALYQQGKMPEAEAAFRKASAQAPADPEAAQMQGVALFRMGKPAEAIPLLERGHTDVKRVNIDGNYVLSLCYMDTRRYDDTRRALAAEYGFSADSAEAYLLAARLFFRREYTPAALESAHKALALAPKLPLVHELLGEIALAESRVPDAVAEFEQERAINPLYGGLYDRLGDAYLRTGEYDKAQQALDRAVLLEPTSTGPYILLGKVLLKQHNPLLATMYLERAVHMDPSNYMSHSLLGQAYRATGRTEEASRETATAEQIQAASTPKLERAQ